MSRTEDTRDILAKAAADSVSNQVWNAYSEGYQFGAQEAWTAVMQMVDLHGMMPEGRTAHQRSHEPGPTLAIMLNRAADNAKLLYDRYE